MKMDRSALRGRVQPRISRAGKAILAAGLVLLLSGCFGVTTTRYATLTGTVRIETEDATLITLAKRSTPRFGGSTLFSRSSPRSTSSAHRVTTTQEYIVYLSGSADRRRVQANLDALGMQTVRRHEADYRGTDYVIIKDTSGRTTSEVIRAVKSLAGVVAVERNAAMAPLATPNDPYFVDQWALQHIKMQQAWDITAGSSSVVVAIVDEGVDFGHPDLNRASLWADGWDFVTDSPYGYNPSDTARAGEHGTMVAGIIGGLTNNGEGIAGVDWRVRLMPLRVFDSQGSTSGEDEVARAIAWAVDHGANVINLSLGDAGCTSPTCPQPSNVLQTALDKAWDAGVPVVAASGNSGGGVVSPANYKTTIAVGATARDKTRASYSGFGPELDLVAPGGDGSSGYPGSCGGMILAPTYGSNAYVCWTGTSIATPHVAGVVSLMLAKGAPQSPEYIRHLLHVTADDLGAAGRDDQTGAGLVDAYGAVVAGLPKVFAAQKSGGDLTMVGSPALTGSGGTFVVSQVPEGTWTLHGWVDVDGSGTVNAGDYYEEYGQVAVRAGQKLTGLNFTLAKYHSSQEIHVN